MKVLRLVMLFCAYPLTLAKDAADRQRRVHTRMPDPDQVNADMLAFWNGQGGHIWASRQDHTDITLAPVADALLAFAAPQAGESVLDVGCGCGGATLEFARAIGSAGRVAALDISGPMLAEGQARAKS